MTVAVKPRSIDYAENGVTVAFPVPWRFNDPAEVKAVRTAASGAQTVLAYGAGYTVAGGSTDAGGTLTLTAPGAAGGKLSIWSETARGQTADYVQNSTFPAETHEARLDNLAMVDQEQDAELQRTLRVPRGEAALEIPPIASRANRYLVFDPLGRLSTATSGGVDGGLRSDLGASTGTGLVGWIQQGVGAVLRLLTSKISEIPVSPEDFGAIGNGIADDADAWAKALVVAVAFNRPIKATPGKAYKLGSAGWTGLSATVTGRLRIELTGARINLGAAPSQLIHAGLGITWPALFKFAGGGVVDIVGGTIDLGGLHATAVCVTQSPIRCDDTIFQNAKNTVAPADCYGIFLLGCPGGKISKCHFAQCGGGIYAGFTTAPYDSNYLTVSENTYYDLRGDFIVGVFSNSLVTDNAGDGSYAFCAMAGYDVGNTRCQNVAITGNVSRNPTGHHIQSDLTGAGAANRPKNITITGNVLVGAAGSAVCGVYGRRIDGLAVTGNRMENVKSGVLLDGSDDFTVTGNSIDGDGSANCYGAGIIDEAAGNGIIANNGIAGFETGIKLFAGSAVTITRNRVRATTRGIWATGTADNLEIERNICSGAATYDLDCAILNVSGIENNLYATQNGVRMFSLPTWAGAATPTIGTRRWYNVANGAAATLTNLSDGYEGQEISLFFSNGNTAVTNGSGINLRSALAPAFGSVLHLKYYAGDWYETGRAA